MLLIVVITSSAPSATASGHATEAFADLPSQGGTTVAFTDIGDSRFRDEILWMATSGLTSGCSPTRYCPDGAVTRGQLASFIARAKTLSTPARDYFWDDTGVAHEDAINRLATDKLTVGCGGGRYCPHAHVTRAQLATFFTRAFGLATTSRDFFTDDAASIHQSAINRLAAAGLTAGCGDGRFCPGGSVTRGQFAAFLFRAMEQPLRPPPTSPFTDLPGWKLIFADDFAADVALGRFSASSEDQWSSYPSPWRDTSGNGVYSTERVVSVASGVLRKDLHYADGAYRVAALMPVLPGGTKSQLYGRYAVRFRADAIEGYKTAWLLWPESEIWPREGEIDFPEGSLDGTIHAFMHRQGATSGSDQDAYSTRARYDEWHTAVIEWAPSSVKFYLDGKLVGHSTSRVPNTPMRWVLQTETDLSATAAASERAAVEIDWVAVWRYEP